MDTFNDPPRETYLKWQRFTIPDKNGNVRTALAMSKSSSDLFIALYTILIGMIFTAAWNILISLVILFLAPTKMNRTTYITVIAVWGASDPFFAVVLMLQHSALVFWGVLKKLHPIEMTWRAFWFDICILICVLGTFAGGLVVGLVFPERFILGNVAPVNPYTVFYPIISTNATPVETLRGATQYDHLMAIRAISSVDFAERQIKQDSGVTLEFPNFKPTTGSWAENEDPYNITYSYEVSGFSMGLQHLAKLSVRVNGSCSFKPHWYEEPRLEDSTETWFEEYSLFPLDEIRNYAALNQSEKANSWYAYTPLQRLSLPASQTFPVVYNTTLPTNQQTGVSYYGIIPITGLAPSVSQGSDPWYSTQPITNKRLVDLSWEVKTGRPPLLCIQEDKWLYGDWTGTLGDLFSKDNGPSQVTVPEGIKQILNQYFANPTVARIGQALNASALKCATRVLQETSAIDAEFCGAKWDMERLVLAAYVGTRDVFRNTALVGASSNANGLKSSTVANALQTNGTLNYPGLGDFNMSTSSVQAVHFGYLIAVPAILVTLTIIVAALKAGRRLKTASTNPSGRFDNYTNLVNGLQVTQIYRMVDQLLAERAPEGHPIKTQAHWKNQLNDFPFVVPNPKMDPTVEVVMPVFQVQVKDHEDPGASRNRRTDKRLILDLPTDRLEAMPDHPIWRPIRDKDGIVKISEVKRQYMEEIRAGVTEAGSEPLEKEKRLEDTPSPSGNPEEGDKAHMDALTTHLLQHLEKGTSYRYDVREPPSD